MAADNLIKEGKDSSKIFITGNTVIDAMQHAVRKDYSHPELEWVGDEKLIFITAIEGRTLVNLLKSSIAIILKFDVIFA